MYACCAQSVSRCLSQQRECVSNGTVQERNTDKTLYISDVLSGTISGGRSKISGSPFVAYDDLYSGCHKHSALAWSTTAHRLKPFLHLLLLSAELDSSSTMQ